MSLVTPPSRREQNKAATRQALVGAAIDLLSAEGGDQVGADAVAERAGVSRRTFFNYFASVEDCVTSTITDLLTEVIERFRGEPADEPIMDAAARAFDQVFTPQATPDLVRVFSLVRANPRMLRSHLAQWSHATELIHTALQDRLPGADPLWVHVLAASLVGVAESAIRAWLDDLDPTWATAPPTPDAAARAAASSADLRDTVRRSFGFLAEGFATPPPTP